MTTTECRNPHCANPATCKHGGYCAACYMFRRRHNDTDRPAHLIEAHYRRTLDALCTQNYTRVAQTPTRG